MDTLNTSPHLAMCARLGAAQPALPPGGLFEQRVLALANRSAHSSSCRPVSFPRRHVSLCTDPASAIAFHLSSCMFNPTHSSSSRSSLFLHVFHCSYFFPAAALHKGSSLSRPSTSSISQPRSEPPTFFFFLSYVPSIRPLHTSPPFLPQVHSLPPSLL